MRRNLRHKFNFWALGSMIIVAMIMLPAFEIFRTLFTPAGPSWQHIKEHLLYSYVLTSFKLVLATVFCSAVVGVSLAWIVTVYDFPLRKYLELAFILPIAIPPYIGAYTYAAMLSYTGPIQTFLRNHTELSLNQKYFSLSNLPGVVFIFTCFLYPYIYLAVRAFLKKHAAQIIESGRILGDSNAKVFFRLILPLIRLPLVAGSTIVALDVLSDYGVCSYFGIGTFSLAIIKAWQNLRDINSALRLAAILLLTVLLISSLEKYSRGTGKVSHASTRARPIRRKALRGWKRYILTAYAIAVFLLTFLIPLGQMLLWSLYSFGKIRKVGLMRMALNTVLVAGTAALIIMFFALIVANYRRLFKGFLPEFLARLSIVGYSIPGAVIAISVLVLFLHFCPSLSRSIVMLIFAYIIRYFTIAYQNVESGFAKLGLDFHASSRTLGKSRLESFFRIDLPLIKPAIIAGLILTFVDIAKELTMVLILRPFNFYTLATKVFEYAHDEMIPESSPASVLIILISMIPVIVYHFFEREQIDVEAPTYEFYDEE